MVHMSKLMAASTADATHLLMGWLPQLSRFEIRDGTKLKARDVHSKKQTPQQGLSETVSSSLEILCHFQQLLGQSPFSESEKASFEAAVC